jgi:L-seryl-tRNA(Ser) seleniumtransferase
MNKETIRRLPSVSRVLETVEAKRLLEQYGHSEVVALIQTIIDCSRSQLLNGKEEGVALTPEVILKEVEEGLKRQEEPRLKPAINATGILLHTGLGRAMMPEKARQAVASVVGCCNLQMDLSDGARVHREHVIKELICSLTGAEDVLLVNNNAGATMLALRALAGNKEVIVSRGELIEIGGAFRLPDIMAESGCVMREVGTTNKTHLRDYERAITSETALVLKVHKSNYDIVGFTQEVGIADLVTCAHAKGVLAVDDLGCGAMIGLEQFGLAHEMTIAESLATGADVVLSSTDKLIGGPQGGLILGKASVIDRIRKHPLYRALRVCKLTLAALEATLRLFKNPAKLTTEHPLYFMLARTPDELRQQAEALAPRLRSVLRVVEVSVVPHESFLGGGSLPTQTLPSYAVRIEAEAPTEFARRLREAKVPVVSRLHEGAVYLDMRTLFPSECDQVVATVGEVIR